MDGECACKFGAVANKQANIVAIAVGVNDVDDGADDLLNHVVNNATALDVGVGERNNNVSVDKDDGFAGVDKLQFANLVDYGQNLLLAAEIQLADGKGVGILAGVSDEKSQDELMPGRQLGVERHLDNHLVTRNMQGCHNIDLGLGHICRLSVAVFWPIQKT